MKRVCPSRATGQKNSTECRRRHCCGSHSMQWVLSLCCYCCLSHCCPLRSCSFGRSVGLVGLAVFVCYTATVDSWPFSTVSNTIELPGVCVPFARNVYVAQLVSCAVEGSCNSSVRIVRSISNSTSTVMIAAAHLLK